MPPARGRRRRVTPIDYQGERTPSRVPEEKERAKGVPHYGVLFDGATWSIWPEDDITPLLWAVKDRDWVQQIIPDEKKDGCGETEVWNWVLRDIGYLEKLQYDVEGGWAGMVTRFQAMCDIMGWKAKTIQRNGEYTEYLLQAIETEYGCVIPDGGL